MNSLSHSLRQRLLNLKIFKSRVVVVRQLNTSEEEVVIPERIPRTSTDILRALESTIQRDATAAHFKYHDDPFLIPHSNVAKRSYALAQESGRKAAHWVGDQHPELFRHKEANPPIKAFFPATIYNENTQVTENDLKEVIESASVSEAVTVYKLCKEKEVEVSDATKQSLLELLCFYNSADVLNKEYVEEKWFRQSSKGKERHKKTWKDGSLAEEIFISIEKPDATAYSALIQGMAKYYQIERAYQLFQESQEKGLILNVDSYSAMIRVSNFIIEGYEQRWALIADILNRIKLAKLKPNLETLNCLLEALSTLGISIQTKENVLKTLVEFKNLGIEPCLASWYFVLMTFCKERGPTSTILHNIMNQIENKEFTIQHIKDTFFFVTAMDVCRYHLHDKELAKRVDKLLHFGQNYDLIGDSYKESIYYRNLFILLCETETLDDFMEDTYFKLVPHIYTPEPAVMGEILNMIDLNSAVNYLPKLFSDMKIFDMLSRENLLKTVSEIIVKNEQPADSDLNVKFATIAWDIYSSINDQDEKRTKQISFTAELLSNILTTLLRNNDFDRATEVVTTLDKRHHNILGIPNIQAMQLYIDHCIKEMAPSRAINCIQYCSDCGFPEIEEMAIKLKAELTLDGHHLEKLSKIVGSFVFDRTMKDKDTS